MIMQFKPITINKRKGWKLNNDILSLFIMEGGGHIAELHHKERPDINPYWIPKWKAIEPWQYNNKHKPKYASKLLASISGHNICLSQFGGPSQEEEKAGLSSHGEAPVVRWRAAKSSAAKAASFCCSCKLPVAQMECKRTVYMKNGSDTIRIKEDIRNLSKKDTPFTSGQHASFGPPFLKEKITRFDSSATTCHTNPVAFSNSMRTKPDKAFKWPCAPGAKNSKVDLRFMGKTNNSDFATTLMNRRLDYAWFSAVNPEAGLLIAYIWDRQDYPWLGLWEERYARKAAPWNSNEFVRGMEFSNAPFPIGLRQAVDMNKFQGIRTYRWLPAGSRLTFQYYIIARPVAENCKGVKSIKPEDKNFNIKFL
jgi:hypothetical protein